MRLLNKLLDIVRAADIGVRSSEFRYKCTWNSNKTAIREDDSVI